MSSSSNKAGHGSAPRILLPIDDVTLLAHEGARTLGAILNRRAYAAAAIAAVLVCTGCATTRGNAAAESSPTPSSAVSSPASPSAAETLEPSSEASTESVPELIFEQTVTVEAMDEMSIEEFAQLPYADRLAYALAKVPDLADLLESDADLAIQDPRYITAGLWHRIRMESLGAYDTLVGSKIYSASQLYTTNLQTGEISPEFTASVESIETAGGGVSLTQDLVYESHGDWQVGTDRLGNPIEFTNLTHVLYDRQGELVPDSQRTAQAVKVRVRTLDGVELTVFPMGYGAKGKVSPEDKYDY